MVLTKKNNIRLAGLLVLFCFSSFHYASAQPSDYERLARQNEQPHIFIDVITLPGDEENSVKLTSLFRMEYPFLSFKKSENPSRGSFKSTAALNIEVFESPRKDLRPNKQVDVEGLNSIGRATWQDTAYAANYEQTQSNNQFVSGSMQVKVKPGYYTYFLKLKNNNETKGRNSRTRNIRVFPYKEQQNGDVILVKSVDNIENPFSLQLINMGSNVPYGQDFYALVHLPGYDAATSYSYEIHRVEPREDEEEEPRQIKTMTREQITEKQIYSGIKPTLAKSANELALNLSEEQNGYTYALLKIPNESYPNALYQLQIKAEGTERPVAKRVFQSYWSDIPTSLLSLDVAIDMLRFISSKETIKRIDDGSDREREQKFRAFWAEKDPTPDTEFNELQAEYYNRIDYAYEEFTTERTLGFNSDRGSVYIRYGPPQDINRTFPPNGPTTEIWTYENRRFVFEATSGFGDFKLVSN